MTNTGQTAISGRIARKVLKLLKLVLELCNCSLVNAIPALVRFPYTVWLAYEYNYTQVEDVNLSVNLQYAQVFCVDKLKGPPPTHSPTHPVRCVVHIAGEKS